MISSLALAVLGASLQPPSFALLPTANASAKSCDGGCDWISEFACPGGAAGSKGFATDDGSASFKCCCGSAADVSLNATTTTTTAAAPMDPSKCNCDWATSQACNGHSDGSVCYTTCCASKSTSTAATATATAKDAPGCKAFCANHKRDDGTNSTWAERCAWKENSCSSCSQCSSSDVKDEMAAATGTSTAGCENWCAFHKKKDGTKSTWAERCAWKENTCSSCSQCSDDSVKTEMASASTTDKGADGCENFCAKHKKADGTSSTWAERCAWKEGKCSSCNECKSDEVLTAIADEEKKKKGSTSGCNTWCATHKRNDGTDSTWPERCAWKDKACSGCAECSSATTSAAAKPATEELPP